MPFMPTKKALGGTKAQVHVEPYGDMVFVIRDKEVDNLLEAFVVLILHIRQLQAAVGMPIVGLDVDHTLKPILPG
jgi:hypothetical protein